MDVDINVVYLQRLMQEINVNCNESTMICECNQSNIKMVHIIVMHVNPKHIDIHVHFVREVQEEGHIDACYISTKEQQVDNLRKPLGFGEFIEMRELIGIKTLVIVAQDSSYCLVRN